MAAAASKTNAYSCQFVERCTNTNPLEKLTQKDLDEFESVLLAAKLDTKLVDKVMNDVLQKFVGDQSMEEIFKAKVTFGICILTPIDIYTCINYINDIITAGVRESVGS